MKIDRKGKKIANELKISIVWHNKVWTFGRTINNVKLPEWITTKKISLWITCGVKYDYYVKYVCIVIHKEYSVTY